LNIFDIFGKLEIFLSKFKLSKRFSGEEEVILILFSSSIFSSMLCT
jgi:hypothetical protein